MKKKSLPTSQTRIQAPPLRVGGLYVDGKRVEPETKGKTQAELETNRIPKAEVSDATTSDPD